MGAASNLLNFLQFLGGPGPAAAGFVPLCTALEGAELVRPASQWGVDVDRHSALLAAPVHGFDDRSRFALPPRQLCGRLAVEVAVFGAQVLPRWEGGTANLTPSIQALLHGPAIRMLPGVSSSQDALHVAEACAGSHGRRQRFAAVLALAVQRLELCDPCVRPAGVAGSGPADIAAVLGPLRPTCPEGPPTLSAVSVHHS